MTSFATVHFHKKGIESSAPPSLTTRTYTQMHLNKIPTYFNVGKMIKINHSIYNINSRLQYHVL